VDVAFRETVVVILVNAPGGTVAGNLRLYLVHGSTLVASCLVFTASGGNFQGNLDLDTAQLETLFGNALSNERRQCDLSVWDTSEKALLVEWKLVVMNNCYDPSFAAPTAADPVVIP
jgi:bifunctional ADP-heptose synthase (sugar kinase/adenylyltransferase)